jgi:hypothetical protein
MNTEPRRDMASLLVGSNTILFVPPRPQRWRPEISRLQATADLLKLLLAPGLFKARNAFPGGPVEPPERHGP